MRASAWWSGGRSSGDGWAGWTVTSAVAGDRADRDALHRRVHVREEHPVRLHPQPVRADREGRRGRADQRADQGAAGAPHGRGRRGQGAEGRYAGDAEVAEDDPVAVVDQQVEAAYRPVEDRPRRRRGGARHAERVRQFQGVRRADRDEGQRPLGELPLPVQQRHRTEQRAVVAEHHGVPGAAPGQGPGEFLRAVRQADLRFRARRQDILRDPYGLAVTSAGDRVDDDQQLVVIRHLGPSSGSIFVQEPLALLRQGLRLFRGTPVRRPRPLTLDMPHPEGVYACARTCAARCSVG